MQQAQTAEERTTQIFSGLVKCADCGWSLAYGMNSQNKNPYAHYHCTFAAYHKDISDRVKGKKSKDELDRSDNMRLHKKIDILRAFLDLVVSGFDGTEDIDAEYNDFENKQKCRIVYGSVFRVVHEPIR